MEKIRKCTVCDGAILSGFANEIYCGEKCKRVSHNARRRIKRKLPCYELKCLWCKQKFVQKIANIQKFCSKKCQGLYQQKSYYGGKPGFQGTLKKCKLCNKEYSAYVPNQKWCSIDCRRKVDYKTNRLNKIAYSAKYNKEHTNKKREWNKKWAKNNPDKILHGRKQYIYRKKGAGGKFSQKDWTDLKNKTGNKCMNCGKSGIELTADHVIPIKKWKSWRLKNKVDYKCNDIENIQPLCRSCNSSKSAIIIS